LGESTRRAMRFSPLDFRNLPDGEAVFSVTTEGLKD